MYAENKMQTFKPRCIISRENTTGTLFSKLVNKINDKKYNPDINITGTVHRETLAMAALKTAIPRTKVQQLNSRYFPQLKLKQHHIQQQT